MGNSSSKPPKTGLKVPSIILEEDVARHLLAPHLVGQRIPTPIDESAFLAALEALTALEPRMRHYASSFRTRSLIKACDDFHDRLYAVYSAYYDSIEEEDELQNDGAADSIAECKPAGASPGRDGDGHSPVSASSTTTLPCPPTKTTDPAACTTEKTKQATQDKGDDELCPLATEDANHVCAKVQSLESKVARLERTVSLLAKLVERSRSMRKQRQIAAASANANRVIPPDAHSM